MFMFVRLFACCFVCLIYLAPMYSLSLFLSTTGSEFVPGGDVGDVEAEYEGERDQVEEGVEILHHTLKQTKHVH